MNLFKSGLIAGLIVNATALSALANPVYFKTRAGYFINAYDSKGNVSAIPNGNIDPNVSDEIFTLSDLNGGSLRSGDKVYLKTRAGYFINAHGSTGNVSAIPNGNIDPNVSDEVWTIYKVGGSGRIRNGDKVYFQTRAGYYINAHGSTGNVKAQPSININPDVSDEVWTIYFR